MTTKEKAKAYDEALKVLHKYDGANIMFSQSLKEEMFPELKESEDERMKNAAIMACKYMIDNFENSTKDYEDAINWLEKQGEHANFRSKIQIGDRVTRNDSGVLVNLSQFERVANKAEKQEQKLAYKEPKFKIGDWVIGRVTNNEPRQISEVTEQCYKTSYGGQYGFSFEDEMHLWTIQDAKNGDVLVMQKTNGTYESIFIFNKIENNRIIQYLHYFTTDADEEICEARSIDGFLGFVGTPVHPATKEQRDLLFQKMKEAGYEWDAEKKELKRIKQEPTESPKDYHSIDPHFGISVEDLMTKKNTADNKETKKTMFDKSAEWSEEDENLINSIIKDFKTIAKGDLAKDCPQRTKNYIPWFKILKDRVQPQPKQEWSEEDVKTLAKMMFAFKTMVLPSADECNKFIEFLKSIRDKGSLQSTWKPSDEQIKGIECAIKTLHHQLNIGDNRLDSLYDDLKKNKGGVSYESRRTYEI